MKAMGEGMARPPAQVEVTVASGEKPRLLAGRDEHAPKRFVENPALYTGEVR